MDMEDVPLATGPDQQQGEGNFVIEIPEEACEFTDDASALGAQHATGCSVPDVSAARKHRKRAHRRRRQAHGATSTALQPQRQQQQHPVSNHVLRFAWATVRPSQTLDGLKRVFAVASMRSFLHTVRSFLGPNFAPNPASPLFPGALFRIGSLTQAEAISFLEQSGLWKCYVSFLRDRSTLSAKVCHSVSLWACSVLAFGGGALEQSPVHTFTVPVPMDVASLPCGESPPLSHADEGTLMITEDGRRIVLWNEPGDSGAEADFTRARSVGSGGVPAKKSGGRSRRRGGRQRLADAPAEGGGAQ